MPGTHVYSAVVSGTPFGSLRIWCTARGLRRLAFRTGPDLIAPGEKLGTDSPPETLTQTVSEVESYLAGDLKEFTVPLDLGAITDFQKEVYAKLQAVGFGKVVSYGQLADELGLGHAGARAVGGAVGANPAVIVVPCHRVVGADGSLHGFSGGLPRKASLLRHEGLVVDGETARSKVHPEELRLPL